MKRCSDLRATFPLFFLLALSGTVTVLAQGGSLVPPGPPGATLLSLDEMEPRTPLVAGAPGVSNGVSGTITISQPGSYYLTSNLTVSVGSGIVIDSDKVTLDLRGFTIGSTVSRNNGSGVEIRGRQVSVFNGHVSSQVVYDPGGDRDRYPGSGFENGIHAPSNTFTCIRIRDVSVSGCNLHGIRCEDLTASVVESCTVNTVGGNGIRAGNVRNCSAETCGDTAIAGRVIDACQGMSTDGTCIYGVTVADSHGHAQGSAGHAHGIEARECVNNCYGEASGGDGIHARTVANSTGLTWGAGAEADGIDASGTVQNSVGQSQTGDGIEAGVVSYSRGITLFGSYGIEANIAVGCTLSGGANILYKYLMP